MFEKKKKKNRLIQGRGSAFRESGISIVSASDARQGTRYGSVERKGRRFVPVPAPAGQPLPRRDLPGVVDGRGTRNYEPEVGRREMQ